MLICDNYCVEQKYDYFSPVMFIGCLVLVYMYVHTYISTLTICRYTYRIISDISTSPSAPSTSVLILYNGIIFHVAYIHLYCVPSITCEYRLLV